MHTFMNTNDTVETFCGACKYWVQDGDFVWQECHRYPPQLVQLGITAWPITKCDSGCGEWVSR